MVESWMDRIARPVAAGPEQTTGELSSTAAANATPAAGWDPYDVWYRQVKQVRDRSPEQYADRGVRDPAHAKVAQADSVERSSDEGSRWRVRIAGLLPRLSG